MGEGGRWVIAFQRQSLRADQIALPYIDIKSSGQPQLLWKPPVYATVNNLLTNPVYAGAYAFGRTGSRMTIENGRKRILRGHRKPRSDWAVLLGGVARPMPTAKA